VGGEVEARARRAQQLMAEQGLDGLLLSSEVNFRYFTGVRSQFFCSPTRPWFVLVPGKGEPVALVAEAAEATMRDSWIEDVRTWPSPRPEDEGVSLVAGAVSELSTTFGRLGVELGPESRLGMPAGDFLRLTSLVAPRHELVDGSGIVTALRMVKSDDELTLLRGVSGLVSAGLAAVPELYVPGDSARSLCKKLELRVLESGAERAPYLVADAGPGGYANPIANPSGSPLQRGDVLYVDAGFTLEGYYSDLNRNWSLGAASAAARRAYELLYAATDAGIAAARPGARAADVWRAMSDALKAHGEHPTSVGRFGHGLGLQLTEPPSLREDDETVLAPGMVLAIEPGLAYDSALMLHEEVVAVTESGAELLTVRAEPELPTLEP
jgi:Xaa-Pro aminopeptidase